MNYVTKAQNATKLTRDDLPPLGSWHWCDIGTNGDASDEEKKERVKLLCVTHIASNHIEVASSETTRCISVMPQKSSR